MVDTDESKEANQFGVWIKGNIELMQQNWELRDKNMEVSKRLLELFTFR